MRPGRTSERFDGRFFHFFPPLRDGPAEVVPAFAFEQYEQPEADEPGTGDAEEQPVRGGEHPTGDHPDGGGGERQDCTRDEPASVEQ